ncbi:MAG: ATP-binding protein [Ignavibacteriales bacterium]|nr:ATP-binding protein [Ignavibacteriales bacterium]
MEIKKKHLTLNFQTSDNLEPIKADNDEITRLFTNLISNAIKYNKENGAIDIKIQSADKYILTSIKDSGIGMKPEEKQKLFQNSSEQRMIKQKI